MLQSNEQYFLRKSYSSEWLYDRIAVAKHLNNSSEARGQLDYFSRAASLEPCIVTRDSQSHRVETPFHEEFPLQFEMTAR